MASVPDRDAFEHDQWCADVERAFVEITKSRAETVKLVAAAEKLVADRIKIGTETGLLPRSTNFQAMIASAALLGAGAVIAKLFFP